MMTLSTTPELSGAAAATTLALWCSALQSGASADAVLDVFGEIGLRAGVRAATTEVARRSGLPGPGEPSANPAELLPVIRHGGAAALVAPAPGDVRGLPVGGAIVGPALESGGVVALPTAGIGLVPIDGQWRAFECGRPHPTLSVAEATGLVDEAVSAATHLLVRADVASNRGNPRDALRRAVSSQAAIVPPGLAHAAATLLDRATTLAAMLTVAAAHDTAAVTAHQTALVGAALAPLHTAVREARRTAVAAAAHAARP